MKKALKIISLCLVICAAVAVFAGCSSTGDIPRPSMTGTAVDVSATCTIEQTSTGVKVSAETNVIDGTLCHVSISGTDGKIISKQTLTVTNGKVSYEFPTDPSWPNKLIGYFACTPSEDGAQPDNVKALYGNAFENMQGEDVLWDVSTVDLVVCSEKITLK